MIKRTENGISGRMLNFNYLVWIKEHARAFGLKGVAFIRDDGSVKVIAEGKEENLIEFEQNLEHKHPFLFDIENFYTHWSPAKNEYKDFSIVN